jgi:hypothetical protein
MSEFNQNLMKSLDFQGYLFVGAHKFKFENKSAWVQNDVSS